MKKRFLFGFLAILALANLAIITTGNSFLYPALYHLFPNIDDYEFFENNTIKKSPQPQPWSISKEYNKKELPTALTSTLEELESVAFLVIQNDEIVIEKYWEDYSTQSLSNSFSMAKSYISALIGVAVKEGKIKSIEDLVANYIPSFKTDGKEKIRIVDILKMSSGLDWEETYTGPLSMATEAYYGDHLNQQINKLKAKKKSNQSFEYLSGDTQVLAMVLQSATGKNISQLLQEKLWQPMGCENDALWSLDKENGMEKAYCCLNSNARDYAKIAKLYMQKGKWNDEQLVPSAYVEASISPAVYENGTDTRYGYMWWLFDENVNKTQNVFYARGILGQYIIAIPEKNIIIVRLGHKRDKEKTDRHPKEVAVMIDAVNAMFP